MLFARLEARHRALSLASQHGHAEIVRLLLDAGEDPNRYNLEGNAHSTPLHQAVLEGHETVVRLLASISTRNNSLTRLACFAVKSRLRQIG